MAREIFLLIHEESRVSRIPPHWRIQAKCLNQQSLNHHLAWRGKCGISVTFSELRQKQFPFPLLCRERAVSDVFFPLRPSEPKSIDWLVALLEFRAGITPDFSRLQFGNLTEILALCETYDTCAV